MTTASTPQLSETAMTTPPNVPPRALYRSLWRAVPRELGFLLLTLPIATAGFVLTISFAWTGVGTIVTLFIGIFSLIVALYISRGFGTLELTRLQWAGREPIARPDWSRTRKPGFWGWIRSLFGNGHYWLYLLHTMIINFVVSLFTWVVTVVWASIALGGVTYWLWSWSIPTGEDDGHISHWLFGWFGGVPTEGSLRTADIFVYLLLGLIFAATLPFLTRGLVRLHDVFARITLGRFASDDLRAQVRTLEQSRGAAISAEGHSLRRLERDIHDGPQQRLVRLQMDLAAADRQVDADPAKAKQLIAEAMQQSKDALEELRSLSRGFAPPILLDRGLVAALESVAIRSALPVTVVASDLPELPQELERNAYFLASELMTNAVKHAGATAIEVRVDLRRVLDDDSTWLDVAVTDDGAGGAVLTPGHGLVGLEERLRGLGGILTIDSPAGGPTIVTGHIPVTTTL
jgi:signal transduction histidine kinase